MMSHCTFYDKHHYTLLSISAFQRFFFATPDDFVFPCCVLGPRVLIGDSSNPSVRSTIALQLGADTL